MKARVLIFAAVALTTSAGAQMPTSHGKSVSGNMALGRISADRRASAQLERAIDERRSSEVLAILGAHGYHAPAGSNVLLKQGSSAPRLLKNQW